MSYWEDKADIMIENSIKTRKLFTRVKKQIAIAIVNKNQILKEGKHHGR